MHTEAAREVAREVLVFTLDDEEYGVDIRTVVEIRSYEGVTPVPGTPPHVTGMISLRGRVVPIVDLRIRFGRAQPRYDALTVVVILQVGTRTVGMVVDGVSDVMELRAGEIQPAPDMGSLLAESFLLEVATHDKRMVLLVDLAKLLDTPELDRIS